MLRISLQTLRARRGSLAGAFVAIFLAVMLAYGTGLLMAGALSAPGPGRLAAADAVVRADPSVTVGSSDPEQVDVTPAPRLPAQAVARAAPAAGGAGPRHRGGRHRKAGRHAGRAGRAGPRRARPRPRCRRRRRRPTGERP